MEHSSFQSNFSKSEKTRFGAPFCLNDIPRYKDANSAHCLPPFPSKRLREALSFGFIKNEPSEANDRNNSSPKNETYGTAAPPLKFEIKLSRSSEKKLFELGYYLSVKHLNIDWEEEKDRCLYKHIKHLRALEKYRKPLNEYILGTSEKVRKEKPRQSVKLYIVKNENSFWYVGKQRFDSNHYEKQSKNSPLIMADKVKDRLFRKRKSCHSPLYNTAKQIIHKRYKEGFDYNSFLRESSLVTCPDNNIRLLTKEPSEVDKMEIDSCQHKLSLQPILNQNVVPNCIPNDMNEELDFDVKKEIDDSVTDILGCGDLKTNSKSIQTDDNYNHLLLSRMEHLLRCRKRLQEQNKILSENLSSIMTDFNVSQVSHPNQSLMRWCIPPEIESSSSPINNLNKLFVRVL